MADFDKQTSDRAGALVKTVIGNSFFLFIKIKHHLPHNKKLPVWSTS